jgi:hypothetical protein
MHVPGIIFTGYVEENQVATIFYESTMVVFPYFYRKLVFCIRLEVTAKNDGFRDLSILVKEDGYKGGIFKP